MKINELKINNLRCFCEAKSEIRPITVIVGENNTGKTTFLSTYKLVHDLLYEDKPIKPSSIEDVLKERSYQYLGGSAHITRKPGNTDIINMGAQFTVGSQDVWNVEYSIQEGRYCRKILMSCLQDTIEVNLKEGHTMEVASDFQHLLLALKHSPDSNTMKPCSTQWTTVLASKLSLHSKYKSCGISLHMCIGQVRCEYKGEGH